MAIKRLAFRKTLEAEALVDDFLAELEARGGSLYTVKNYRSDLVRFCGSLNDGLESLSVVALRKYLSGLSKLAATSRARHFASINKFLSWCYRHDYLASNPMEKFEPPKRNEPAPRAVSEVELKKIEAAFPKLAARERLLFTLLGETGIRVGEALGVYVEDVVLDSGQEHLRIRGKGGSFRQVPLPFELKSLNLLRRYTRENKLKAGPLFRTGKSKGRPMTYNAALYQWGKLCESAGVRCKIHQLRHTLATEMINSGVPVGTIRRILGHKNLQTTQRYAELKDSAARKDFEDFVRGKRRK